MEMDHDHPKLLSIHTLLHLIHHRNKNQHGNTKWWKWLAILNRSVSKLVRAAEVEAEESRVYYHSPRESKSRSRSTGPVDGPVDVDGYKEYLARHVIPRCYLAFSTVVADNQFAVLGVVLISILADLTSLVGGIKLDSLPEPTAEADETEKVAADKSKDKNKSRDRDGGSGEVEVTHPFPHPAAVAAGEDVGEVVIRGKESTPGSGLESGSNASGKRSAAPGSASEGSSKRKKSKGKPEDDARGAMKKKKGKKNNSIDDLFSGVL